MGLVHEITKNRELRAINSTLIPLVQLKWEDVEDPLLGKWRNQKKSNLNEKFSRNSEGLSDKKCVYV